MYKRQQRINLQLAQEVNSIEVQSLHCLLNDHCPLGNSFELYESHINIHQEGQSATILVTGKHNFLIDCSFDVEKNRLITYTYNANQ